MSVGKLTLVATPIGNLGDITTRAVEALGAADLVVAEDTRRSGRLLQFLGLKKPMISFFEGNQVVRTRQIVDEVRAGKRLALITDAGSPTVSDPGYELVYACLEAGLDVEAVPGACAAVMALQLSGLPPDRMIFDGFLPRKGKARKDRLAEYRHLTGTLVLYESPNRLLETLDDLLDALGDVPAAVLREMTKLHEEAVRGPLAWLREELGRRDDIKGEIALVVRLLGREPVETADALTGARRLRDELGLRTKDAAAAAAIFTGADKKALYRALTEDQHD